MLNTLKKTTKINSKYDDNTVLFGIQFTRNGEPIKSLSFETTEGNLKRTSSLIKNHVVSCRDYSYQFIIDKVDEYDIFLEEDNIEDLSEIFTKQNSGPYQHYIGIAIFYMSCSNTIQPFIQKHRADNYVISLSIDYDDRSQNTLSAIILNDNGKEFDITEHPLN